MRELTIYIDDYEFKELDNYLLTIDGIEMVKLSCDELLCIDILYDEKLISDKIIKLEILTFLGRLNCPCIYAFNKYDNKNNPVYQIVLDNICCEYCYAIAIEELYDIDGIMKVESNFYDKRFNQSNDKNYVINIYYDSNILSEEKMHEIEIMLNIYE